MALPAIQPGRTVRFALLPEGKDPDDLVRTEGAGCLPAGAGGCRGRWPSFLWMRETGGGVFDTPERKAELEKTLRDLTSRIKDENVRFHYAQEMRERVQTFFGRARQKPLRAGEWERRGPQGQGQPPQGGQFARPGAGASRFAVSESLARSAMVKRAGGVMPLREARSWWRWSTIPR